MGLANRDETIKKKCAIYTKNAIPHGVVITEWRFFGSFWPPKYHAQVLIHCAINNAKTENRLVKTQRETVRSFTHRDDAKECDKPTAVPTTPKRAMLDDNGTLNI